MQPGKVKEGGNPKGGLNSAGSGTRRQSLRGLAQRQGPLECTGGNHSPPSAVWHQCQGETQGTVQPVLGRLIPDLSRAVGQRARSKRLGGPLGPPVAKRRQGRCECLADSGR